MPREVVQRHESLLAAVTALARAAERQLDARAGAVRVDEHLSAPQPLRDPELAAAVTGPHRGDQAVLGGVGQPHGVRFVVERQHREHRPEHLFAGERTVRAAPRRRASVRRRSPPGDTPSAIRPSASSGMPSARARSTNAMDPGFLLRRDDRAAVEIHLRRAGAQPGEGVAQPLDDLRRTPRSTSTRLPAEQVWPAFWTIARQMTGIAASKIRVREDDLGRLASKLQRARNEVIGCQLLNLLPDRRRPGERHEVHTRVRRERRARHGSAPGHYVDGALREPRLGDECAHPQRPNRRHLPPA